jgi:hypothetical protein
VTIRRAKQRDSTSTCNTTDEDVVLSCGPSRSGTLTITSLDGYGAGEGWPQSEPFEDAELWVLPNPHRARITQPQERGHRPADELTAAVLSAGGERLRRTVAATGPAVVARVGLTAYRAAFPTRTAVDDRLGVQNAGRLRAPSVTRRSHTADIDRPFSYEQFADDTAALLDHVGLDRVDVYGYSLGGGWLCNSGCGTPSVFASW